MKILVFILLLIGLGQADIAQDASQLLKTWVGDSTHVQYIKFEIPAEIKSQVEQKTKSKFWSAKIDLWKISTKSGEVLYAFQDHEKGKVQAISFLALLNSKAVVQRVGVVKYRESIGGQISHPAWLKKFQGTQAQGSWNIDGISGATISVNAMISGVRRIATLQQSLTQNKKLP